MVAVVALSSTAVGCTQTSEKGVRVVRSGNTVVGPECEDADGRDIDQLPDIVVEAVSTPEVRADASKVGEVTVPAVDVDGVSVPEEVIDGGCIIHYDAPEGCLGAVEITSITIPDASLPGYRLSPGSAVGGGESVVPDASAEGSTIPGAKTEKVCGSGSEKEIPVEGIVRPSVHRPSGYRASVIRKGAVRERVCSESVCTPAVSVPLTVIPSVTVEAVTVPEETLVRDDDDSDEAITDRSYVGSTDVFFDVDKSTLRPEAVRSLREIAADIRDSADAGTIVVEGHTDSTASEEYNQRLSEDRAKSVADWLRDEGDLRKWRISERGYGETRPAASNDTEAGRQANRRVVIRVRD